MAKFFKFPFATSGDRTAIPDTTQSNGSVSYEAGFGSDYQKNLATDPAAKPIPRTQTNELYYEITLAIQQYQTLGVPDFITSSDNGGSPYPYGINARVRYNDGVNGYQIFESRINSNTNLPTVASAWRTISNNAQGVPIGAIIDFGGATPPAGYLMCDGSAVSRTTYADLFAAIGTEWGIGDGSTTFNLPELSRRTTIGSGGAGTSVIGNAVGDTGGEETHTLTEAEIPSHNHGSIAAGGQFVGTGAGGPGNYGSGVLTTDASPTTGNTGGGAAHNIMQPSAVVNKIIKF